MPKIRVNGAKLHYEEQGRGDETVVFAHGLLWSGRMFDAQVTALRDAYRCVTFDFRGQGQSEITADGYDMDTLAADAQALIEHLDAGPCHFLGLSMGGFVGMRLASRHPSLIRSLMLLATTAEPEAEAQQRRYRVLNFVARWFGLRLVASRVMPIMFGQKLMRDPARAELRRTWRRRLIHNHRLGITRAVKGVIDRQGVVDELPRITVPTLILAGEQDAAIPYERAERLHAGIAGSRLVVIPEGGHSMTIEEPGAVNGALREFLEGH